MTNKPRYGTLGTTKNSDSNRRAGREAHVVEKMKVLLGSNKVRFSRHANHRMSERNVIDYEVRQALNSGRHDPGRDRFSEDWDSWEYSIEGLTRDGRRLRIGISFEVLQNGERLLIVTVIDPAR
jgi:hypothetical protein